ncbi:MAG: hypothetical protein GVY36_05435 [Verrucomicrobia bacterium]|jgi:hypothetical protein|nr:hypothetical protein [Verrucomicrobiota bacterium]
MTVHDEPFQQSMQAEAFTKKPVPALFARIPFENAWMLVYLTPNGEKARFSFGPSADIRKEAAS